MNIIAAPDSFKGSLSAAQICNIIERAAHELDPDTNVIHIPAADGGEGTVESILASVSGDKITRTVTGPVGDPVDAEYAILDGQRAVIEMASASGLTLVPGSERNVLLSSTYGTGQLIRDALDRGCREILIGIGGSATNDGGAGMAAALGVRFLDAKDRELDPVPKNFTAIRNVDLSCLDPRIEETRITMMSDVRNPLLGPEGATHIYGPQKGVTAEIMESLESAMADYIKRVESAVGFRVADIPGAGAAGGLGAGLLAFTRAESVPGVDAVLGVAGFDDKLRSADLVITGEGCMDAQSAYGKVSSGVALRCKAAGVPCIALVGSIGDGAETMYEHGITEIAQTSEPGMPLAEAIANAEELCYRAALRVLAKYLK